MDSLNKILADLENPREDERIRAAKRLLENPELDAASALAVCLRDKSLRVRKLAAAALSSIGAQALTVVLPCLVDPDPGVRALALEVAKNSGNEGLDQLAGLLASPDKNLRKFGVEAITLIRGAEDLLINALDDPDLNVRIASVEALGIRQTVKSAVIPKLSGMLSSETNFLALLTLIETLCALEARETLPNILELVIQVPLFLPPAIEAWGKLGTFDGLGRMFHLARTEETVVALLEACQRLLDRGEKPGTETLDGLKPLVLSRFHLDCGLALLLTLYPESLEEKLPELLRSKRLSLRLENYLAEHPEALEEFIGEEYPEALALLSRLAEEERLTKVPTSLIERVALLVNSIDPHLALEAAVLLEHTAGPGSGPILARIAGHSDPELAERGLRALARLAEPEALPVALEALRRPEASLWEAAASVLTALCDVAAIPDLKLLHGLHQGTDRGLWILAALAALGAATSADFEGYLAHLDASIRFRAANLLLKTKKNASSGDLIFSLLNDPDPRVRFAAIRHLVHREGDVIEQFAFVLANDENSSNRWEVLSALLERNDAKARNLFQAEIESLDPRRAEEARCIRLEFEEAGRKDLRA